MEFARLSMNIQRDREENTLTEVVELRQRSLNNLHKLYLGMVEEGSTIQESNNTNILAWISDTEEKLEILRKTHKETKDTNKEEKKEKKKELENMLGNYSIPQLSTPLEYLSWATAVQCIKSSTKHLEKTRRDSRLHSLIMESLTNSEVKKKVQAISEPMDLIKSIEENLGTTEKLIAECKRRVKNLCTPTNWGTQTTNCEVIRNLIIAMKNGPGLESWDEELFSSMITKATTRDTRRKWESKQREAVVANRAPNLRTGDGNLFTYASNYWSNHEVRASEDYNPEEAYNRTRTLEERLNKRKLFFLFISTLIVEESVEDTATSSATSNQVSTEEATINAVSAHGMKNLTTPSTLKPPSPPQKTFAQLDKEIVNKALQKFTAPEYKEKWRRCPFIECSEKHPWGSGRYCPIFMDSDLDARRKLARSRGFCFLCITKGHTAQACKSKIKCTWAGCTSRLKHNPSLCPSIKEENLQASLNRLEVQTLYSIVSIDNHIIQYEDPPNTVLDEHGEPVISEAASVNIIDEISQLLQEQEEPNDNVNETQYESVNKIEANSITDTTLQSLMKLEENQAKQRPVEDICLEQIGLQKVDCEIGRVLGSSSQGFKFQAFVPLTLDVPQDHNFNSEMQRRIFTENGKNYIKLMCLLDIGASVSLIKGEVAEGFQLSKICNINLNLKTVNAVTSTVTTKYFMPLNLPRNLLYNIDVIAYETLGEIKLPSQADFNNVKTILERTNWSGNNPVTVSDLSWPTRNSIDLVIGLTDMDLLSEDNTQLNKLVKTKGIKFCNSPISKKPYIVGCLDEKNMTPQGIEEVVGFTKVEAKILERYIMNEGHLPLNKKKCKNHSYEPSCHDCDLRNQISDEDYEVCKKLKEQVSIVNDGQTKKVEVKYLFKGNPQEDFNIHKSNRVEAISQSIRAVRRMLNTLTVEEVKKVYQKGIDEGCFEVLTPQQEAEMLKKPHNYTFTQLAFNKNSKSTPIRHVVNPSNISKANRTTVNSAQVTPPNLNNKLINALMAFTLLPVPYSSDIAHAFRTVLLSPEHQPYQLLVFFDFGKEDWWNHPLTIKQKTLMTGGQQSQLLLELVIRELVAPTIENQEAKKIVLYNRLVDNHLHSFRTQEEMKTVAHSISEAYDSFSMSLKTIYDTSKKFSPNDDIAETDILLGYQWNRVTDQLTPNISLNKTKKIAGKTIALGLTENPLDMETITRREVTRVNMELFDPTGITIGPFLMSPKVIFRKVCSIATENELDVPLHTKDIKIAEEAAETLNKLTQISRAQPFPRGILEEGETLEYIIGAKDGSPMGYGATVHFVLNGPNGRRSRLVRSACKLHISTVPINEALGFPLLTRLLNKILLVIHPMLTHDERRNLKVYLVGDNVPISYTYITESSHTIIKNATLKCKQESRQLTRKFENLEIKMIFLKSDQIPADICSKPNNSPVAKVNSDLWRKGPEVYLSIDSMPFFAHFTNDQYEVYPSALQPLSTIAPQNPAGPLSAAEVDNDEDINDKIEEDNEVINVMVASEVTNPKTYLKTISSTVWKGQTLPVIKKLPTEFYKQLLTTSPTLEAMILKLVYLYKVSEWNKPTKTTLEEKILKAWTTIIRTSQENHPPTLPKQYTTKDKDGIKILDTSTKDVVIQDVCGTNIIPVIGQDFLLLEKLIMKAHSEIIPLGRMKGHKCQTSTLADMRRGPFPTFSVNLKPLINRVTYEKCISCIRTRVKTGNAEVATYVHLTNFQIFEKVSLDLVGPVSVRNSTNTRGISKMWLLPITCIQSGLTEILVADGYDTTAVVTALLMLQQRYTGIKSIVVDHGTQLQNLNLKGYNPRTASEAQVLNLLEEVKIAAVRGQQISYVESKIRQMKKLWRTIYPQKLSVLPKLTICQLMLLISYTCRIINTIPFAGQAKLCPADLLGFSKIQPVELDITGTNHKKLDEQLHKLQDHRTQLLQELLKIKLVSKELYLKRRDGSVEVEVKQGDIVIIRNKNLPYNENEKIGEVIDLSDTTAIVRTKTKVDKYLKRDLTVLVKKVPDPNV